MREACDVIGVAPEMAANSALANASTLTQRVGMVQLSVGTGRRAISGYFLTLAKSGERKSAVDAHFGQVLHELTDDDLAEYQMLMRLYMPRHKKWKKELKKAVDGKDGEEDTAEAERLASKEPEAPRDPTLSIGDVTIEAVADRMSRTGGCLTIANDDAGSFFGGHSQKAENKANALAIFNILWESRRYTRDRVGSGSVTIESPRLTLNLAVQPDVFRALNKDGLSNASGMTARFYMVEPEPRQGTDDHDSKPSVETPRRDEWDEAMDRLYNMGGGDVIKPTPEAVKYLGEQWNGINARLGEGASLSTSHGFASKVQEHAVRLAAIVAVLDAVLNKRAVPMQLTLKDAQRGFALAEWYAFEAARIGKHVPNNVMDVDTARLRAWLTKRAERDEVAGGVVTTRDIIKSGPRELRLSSATVRRERAIAHLISEGTLARLAAEATWRVRTQP